MGITDEELQTIMEEDQSHEQQLLPTESWNAPLPILYDDVQWRVKLAAEWMKEKKTINNNHESIVERYLQLTNVLLGLRLWGDDIVVQGESALGTIEKDSTGFEILAPRLRTCFQEMLTILANVELFTETNDDFSEFDELEQLVQHLRNFAGPLRTYQESAKNVGDVSAIRAAAAACLQKHPHLPTTVSDNLEEKASPAPFATPSTNAGSSDRGSAEHGSKAFSILATESCVPPFPSTAAAAKSARLSIDARVPNDHQPPEASQALPPALPAESAPKPPPTKSVQSQHSSDSDAETQPPDPLSAALASPAATTAPDDVWNFSIPVPGSKKKQLIFHRAPSE